MTKHEYIQANLPVVRKLVKAGEIPPRVITEFHLYRAYKSYKHIGSKMQRYEFVAIDQKTSLQKVMRAVKNMEKRM